MQKNDVFRSDKNAVPNFAYCDCFQDVGHQNGDYGINCSHQYEDRGGLAEGDGAGGAVQPQPF